VRRLLLVLLLVASATVLLRGGVSCGAFGLQPACYAALLPGPAEDTLRLVEAGETPVYASAGELLLTTVAVEADLDVVEWLRYLVSSRVAEVPRESIFPPGEDAEDVATRNAALMSNSQLDATLAALAALDYEIDTEFDGARIEAIQEPSAVDADQVREGDVIVAVDGQPVDTNEDVIRSVSRSSPGEEITLRILRDGTERDETLTVVADPDDPEAPRLGLLLSSYLELPVDVHIDAGVIGGPSAGLMFSLAIVDLLQPEDLTGGVVIAGTGTIDRDGTIGAIGGIQQKVLGAVSRGDDARPASVFLVPAGNLREAAAAPIDRDLTLVPVATLQEALEALADLRAGRSPVGAVALPAS
jgi:PDZ domain-containing protein